MWSIDGMILGLECQEWKTWLKYQQQNIIGIEVIKMIVGQHIAKISKGRSHPLRKNMKLMNVEEKKTVELLG